MSMPLGFKHTEETKQLMSSIAKGNQYALGSKRSEELKQRLSKAHKGQNKGKPLTTEHRRKIAAGNKRQFCIRGHDTFITGRSRFSNCTRCERERSWKNLGILNESGQPFTWEDYERHLKLQEYRCKITTCKSPSGTFLVTDHDHLTGLFRGLICKECNSHRVGMNDLDSALALVEYFQVSRR